MSRPGARAPTSSVRTTQSAGNLRNKTQPTAAATRTPSAGSISKGSHTSVAGKKTGSSSVSRSDSGDSQKLSQRLNPKTVNPFAGGTKNKSAFATLYTNGGVPCRLVHGSVKHKLGWNPPPQDVSFDPVLITLAEGIRETVHPYTFVAREGFKELLETPGAAEKARSLTPKLVQPIRMALASTDVTVFEAGLDALLQLSNVAGPTLNVHLKTLLASVGKRSMEKKFKEKVTSTLQQLENNGGKEALQAIKSKVPTYQSVGS